MRSTVTVLLALLTLALLPLHAVSEVPHLVNYQGILTDLGGVRVDGVYSLTFRLYPDSTLEATALWEETHDSVHVDDGLFHVILGGTNPLLKTLFVDDSRWLGITLEGEPEMAPRMRITSAPWALKAAQADTAQVANQAEAANHAVYADTATYALSGGTSADTDWVIDGDNIYRLNGEVGVGTSSPGARLGIVESGVNIPGLRVSSGTSGLLAVPGLSMGGYNPLSRPGNLGLIFHNGAQNTGALLIAPWSPTDAGLKIDSVGNVGIGTSGPTQKLQVQGTVYSASGGFKFPDGTLQSTAAGTSYWTGAGSDIHSTNTGNVGVGTTSPTQRLDVSGGIQGDEYYLRGKHIVDYMDAAKWRILKLGGGIGLEILDSDVRVGDDLSPTSDGNYDFGTSTRRWKTVYAGSCNVSGDVTIDGDLCVIGEKLAVVPTSQGMTKVYSEESAEVWFTDYGTGRLLGGQCCLELPSLFLETVTIDRDHPMMVFVQEEGECNGLRVAKSLDGFCVIEKGGGTSQASFSYRVVAKRKGFEDRRLEPMDGDSLGVGR